MGQYNSQPDLGAIIRDLQNQLVALARRTPSAVDPGTIIARPYSQTPSGFLPCDGSAVPRADYPRLHALAQADGYPHGAGNGSTTFNLPDGRGRNLIGVGTHPDINSLTDTDGLAVGSRTPKHTYSGRTNQTDSSPFTVNAGTFSDVSYNTHTHLYSGSTDGGGRLPVHYFIKV